MLDTKTVRHILGNKKCSWNQSFLQKQAVNNTAICYQQLAADTEHIIWCLQINFLDKNKHLTSDIYVSHNYNT